MTRRRASRLLAGLLFVPLAAAQALEPQRSATPEQLRELMADDRWREALVLVEPLVASVVDDPRLVAAAGEVLFRAGRFAEVEALLAPQVERPGATPRTLVTLARLRSAEGRRAEAIELLERAVRSAPDDPYTLYWAGDLAADRAEAIRLLTRFVQLADEGDAADRERIEAAEGSIRVLTQLGDLRLWTPVELPERVEVPLTALPDASGRTLGYVVETRLGEKAKKARLLLDTGSHGLFLVERIARKRGIEPLAETTLFGGGGEGRHATRRGLIDPFYLESLVLARALTTTTRRDLDATGRFHGLLGVSAFSHYRRLTLDLAKRTLVLERDAPPLDGEPFWWVSGQLLVRCASAAGPTGLFVLDTGATTTALAEDWVGDIDPSRLDEATELRAFGGRVDGARMVRGVEVRFGAVSTDGAPLVAYDFDVTSRVGGVEVAGLLGLDVLAGRRVVLDLHDQRVRVD